MVKKLFRKLRNSMMTPLAIALCDSLEYDPQDWEVEEIGKSALAHHSSDRFWVSRSRDGVVSIETFVVGLVPFNFGFFDAIFLKLSIKSAVTYQSKRSVSGMFSILKSAGVTQ